MADKPLVICVGNTQDRVCRGVSLALQQEYNVHEFRPDQLADLKLDFYQQHVCWEQTKIQGFLFFDSPRTPLATNFQPEDQVFCHTELKALLLMLIQYPTVYVLNRYAPDAWFEGGTWTYWRRYLLNHGIPLTQGWFGGVPNETRACWYPYLQFASQSVPQTTVASLLGIATFNYQASSSVYFFQRTWVGTFPRTDTLLQIRKLLYRAGIQYGRLWLDDQGQVLSVDTAPGITDTEIASPLVQAIHQSISDDLLSR